MTVTTEVKKQGGDSVTDEALGDDDVARRIAVASQSMDEEHAGERALLLRGDKAARKPEVPSKDDGITSHPGTVPFSNSSRQRRTSASPAG